VKITSLLTQYLYNHHRLDLPGIGTFLLDPSAIHAVENSKQRSAVLEGISFENNPTIKESPDLVAYISAQTGKMKSLASSDLESYLEVAQQFLNIGKPFTFEGIGTLVKKSLKECEFVPISVSAEKMKELHTKEATKAAAREENTPKYESFLSEPILKHGWKKPVIALALVCGLGLTIWGGYAISKNAAGNKAADSGIISETPAVDTSFKQAPPPDSLEKPAPLLASNNYKYVLEEGSQQRATKRYNQLRTNLWDVKLETSDSVKYKLYLLLPSNADTTRVLDSLTVMTGKRVYIEHQN
jgi:glycine cleavage system H lipoate-binding protein